MNGSEAKDQDVLLQEIKNEVAIRLSKIDEQKLHVLLLGDVISKDIEMKEKYIKTIVDFLQRVPRHF